MITVREWVQVGLAPIWSDCARLSPELRSWQLQFGNLSVDSDDRLWRRRVPPASTSQHVVPLSVRRSFIQQYHDSIFAGHLGVSRTVYHLLDRVYWPGLREDVRSYIASLPALGGLRWAMFPLGPGGYGHSGHVGYNI